MSVFDPERHNSEIDAKIIAGLERISRVFKSLLIELGKNENLTPTQIQFMTYLLFNDKSRCRITDIADEFNLTKATVSDAISALEAKGLVEKSESNDDKRSQVIKLTSRGKSIARKLSKWADSLTNILENFTDEEKKTIVLFLFKFIESLYNAGVITVQRMCLTCLYFQKKGKSFHCKLLDKPLGVENLRLNCEDYQPMSNS